MDPKKLIGGGLAVLLLLFYSALVIYAVVIVLGYGGLTAGDFTPGMANSLTTISGLVAAFVIAELAVTPPGKSPGVRLFTSPANPPSKPSPPAKTVSWIYLLIWVATGATAFIVGVWLPEKSGQTLPTLTDLGKSWFGLAVAAGYSYLGVQPNATD